jgi:prolyl oligopeptidase
MNYYILVPLIIVNTLAMAQITYPITRSSDHLDLYHGTPVSDPYRWLEDDNASEVKAWVSQQNLVTDAYLQTIPYRQALKSRISRLLNYPRFSTPEKVGDYYFFYKNDGLQNQPVIYIQHGLQGSPEVFIDPNSINPDGTVAVSLLGASADNRFMAYAQSMAGSDWQQIRIIDIASREVLPDSLQWVKFSGAAWYKNGFFYSRYPAPDPGTERSGNNRFHAVYYHKLGTDQAEDILVYEDKKHGDFYHYGNVTEDERFFILYAAPGTDGFATYCIDLNQPEWHVKPLFTGYNHKSTVINHVDGQLLVLTDIQAPTYSIIAVNPDKPQRENWQEIVPASSHLIETASTGGGKLFVRYLENATGKVYQMDYDGQHIRPVLLPGLGTASGFSGKSHETQLFYSFTSFIYPSAVFAYDIDSGKSTAFFSSSLNFNPEDYIEKQVFYTSNDGTEIPMFVVHKKDIQLNGKNPTYLYGYGGFNVNLTPAFSASRLVLLENGGVFAMPNLRGGGEFGEQWHKAGMLFNKQQVFDDFIAAAEFLIQKKYTSPARLGIAGGSNGGLLVGACMTQRPDLFAVALPAVGVMDMLRYHLFTVGKGWIPEYGSSEDPAHFKNLIAYSPLHNLKEGTAYPATLITTADHDDRVVPAHSFKFAAQLQKSHAGKHPVLIRIETQAGHGAGKPIAKVIEEAADVWSFFFWNTKTNINSSH